MTNHKSMALDRGAEIISEKITSLKQSWPGLDKDERKRTLYGLHFMLASSSELIQEAALGDIVPSLETEPEYRAGIKAAKELLNRDGLEDQNIVSGERHSILLFPAEVMTGAAGNFADVYSQYLEAPKSFLFMDYLTCLGSVISNKVWLESQIRPQPRLYTVNVGESAFDRKSTAASQTIKFFNGFYNFSSQATKEFTVCYGVGSAEGLAMQLEKVYKLLLFADELKTLVQKMKVEGSILLPCINSLFEENCFHSATKKHTISLDNAFLSLLACCTLETYQTIFSSQFIDIGLVNRLFIVLGKGYKRFAIPKIVPEPEKIKLFGCLEKILGLVAELSKDGPYAMPIEAEAFNFFENWYLSTPMSVFAKRLDTYGHRLMLLLALNQGKATIDTGVVTDTIKLLDYQLVVRKHTDPIDCETRIATIEERIKRILAQGPILKRDLERKGNKSRYGSYLWSWAINNLIGDKEISYDSTTKMYWLLDGDGEVSLPNNDRGPLWEGLY